MTRIAGTVSDLVDIHFTGFLSSNVNLYVSTENRYHLSLPDAICLHIRLGALIMKMVRRFHSPTSDLECLDCLDYAPLRQRHMRLMGTWNSAGQGRYRPILGVSTQHSVVPRAELWAQMMTQRRYLKIASTTAESMATRQDLIPDWNLTAITENLYPEVLEVNFNIDSDSEESGYSGDEREERQITRNQAEHVLYTSDLSIHRRLPDSGQLCFSGAACVEYAYACLIKASGYYRIIRYCADCGGWKNEVKKVESIETDDTY